MPSPYGKVSMRGLTGSLGRKPRGWQRAECQTAFPSRDMDADRLLAFERSWRQRLSSC